MGQKDPTPTAPHYPHSQLAPQLASTPMFRDEACIQIVIRHSHVCTFVHLSWDACTSSNLPFAELKEAMFNYRFDSKEFVLHKSLLISSISHPDLAGIVYCLQLTCRVGRSSCRVGASLLISKGFVAVGLS